MKNTDIFSPSEGYDMVVSVTKQTINDQILVLANPDVGIVKTSTIFGVEIGPTGDYVAKFYDTWDEVPKDAQGNPKTSVLSTQYLPQIEILESGTHVILVLELQSGFAWLFDPLTGQLKKYDVKGWTYGLNVDLAFVPITGDDLHKGMPVDPTALQKLEAFSDQNFSIAQLFADLTNVNTASPDGSVTSVGTAGAAVLTLFSLFMSSFFNTLKAHPEQNPYILGYAITKPSPDPDEDKNVPPSLKPIGQTFTVYKDATNDGLSNVNYCLNTLGGQGADGPGNHPSPGNFDTNWISSTEQCQAKMIYSTFCLLETLILKPFYDSYSSSCHSEIGKSGITIQSNPPYNTAIASTATGMIWTIANQGGDDTYKNSYSVDISTVGASVTLSFKGSINVYKSVSQNDGICTANAWASGYCNWEASVVITASKDATGAPILNVTPPAPSITGSGSDSGENTCAKAFSWMGKVIGDVLDIFGTFGLDNGFFSNLFQNLLSPSVPGSFSPVATLDNLASTINQSFVLPAGQEFFFKNPSADVDGNLSVELTYKTGTGLGAKRPNDHHEFEYSENPFSRTVKRIKPPLGNTLPPKPAAPIKTLGPAAPNPYAQPLVDKFKLDTPGPANSTCDISVSCELMTNSLPGMPVEPTKQFSLAQDTNGDALIFALGSNSQFNILIGQSGVHGTGFKTINLGSGFSSFKRAVCFAVSQDEEGLISVAFTLVDDSDNQGVFYAARLSNDLSVTDFSQIATMATKVQGLDPTFVVENLMVGTSDDGQRPLLLIQGKLGQERSFYQLQSSESTPDRVEFPENVGSDGKGLLSIKMGYAFGQRTNYFLYEIGQTISLVGITIPDGSRGSSTFDYSPGNKSLPVAFQSLSYNSITTATSRAGVNASSDIFIAAESGIYRIPNAKASGMEVVTDQIKDAREIFVATTTTTISLWVVASPNMLWYIYGTKTPDTTAVTWSAPTQFATGVIHVAGMRSRVTNANEIFTINQDMSISRYWQDPLTTNWNSRTESVPQSNYVLQYNSFTSQVHIEQNGLPLAGVKLNVSSSEWQYYAINGLIYSLDADTTAELATDIQGNVTIISTAIDISPATLHVQSLLFKETLNIYPNGKVNHHLQKVTDASSLQSAQTQDGKPVVDPSVTTDTAGAVATNIAQVNSVATQQYPPAAQGNIFTAVETPVSSGDNSHLKHSATQKLKMDHLKNGVITGMIVVNGKWQLHPVGQAEKLLDTHLETASFGDIFGDAWHWIENFVAPVISTIENGVVKLKDGTSFILHKLAQGLEFVLVLTDKTLRIALQTLGAVFKALNWILKLVGIDLGAILAWLGHLLGLDDVWATQQLIASMTKNFLDFANVNSAKYIELARQSAKAFFAGADISIRNAILPTSVQNDTTVTATTSADQSSDAPSVATAPPANYATYHLQHSMGSGNQSQSKRDAKSRKAINDKVLQDDPFSQFYNDVLEPAFNIIVQKVGTTAEDLLKLISDMSLDDLRTLLAGIVDALISVLATIVDGFLKFFEDILTDITNLLEEEVDIPIIGAFWDFLCDLYGSSEPFSVVNAVALVAAIPSVIAVKITTGSTPNDLNNGYDDPSFPAKVEAWLKPAESLPATTATRSEKAATTSSFQCPPALKQFSISEGLISPFSSICGTVCDACIANGVENEDLETISMGAGVITALLSWPVPDDDQDWDMYSIRWVSWAVGTIAGLAPKIPPPGKAVANIILVALAIVVDVEESQDVLTWTSDMGGTISSFVAEAGAGYPAVSVPAYAFSILAGSLIAFANALAKSVDSDSAQNDQHPRRSWKSIKVGGA